MRFDRRSNLCLRLLLAALVVAAVCNAQSIADRERIQTNNSKLMGNQLSGAPGRFTEQGVSFASTALETVYLYACDDNHGLWTIGPDGTATLVVQTDGIYTDIAFAPDGTLYAVDFTTLWVIDATSGTSQAVGLLDGAQGGVNALTYAAANSTLSAAETQVTFFYQVDPMTALATAIGDMGYSSAGDLAYADDGTLYMTTEDDTLITVDPTTGAATLVGPIGYTNVYGLEFVQGQLYGLTNAGEFLSIDTTTGAGTLIANTPVTGTGLSLLHVPMTPSQ